MLEIQFNTDAMLINGKEFRLPFPVNDLVGVLGEARRTVTKYSRVYTWDDLGFAANSTDDKLIGSVDIEVQPRRYNFAAKSAFKGRLSFDGHEAFQFYAENKEKIPKLYEDMEEDGGSVVRNGMAAWFMVDDAGRIQSIHIEPHETKAVEVPTQHLSVDSEFKNLEAAFLEWIAEIEKIVPKDNKYFKLKSGLTADELKNAEKLKTPEIPTVLLNLYKVRNFHAQAVTSAFKFSVAGHTYDLLSLNEIAQCWSDIQDLQSEDGAELELPETNDSIKLDNYANPKWVPFAQSRQGNYLLVDMDPGSRGKRGQVIELQNESWKRAVVADSLESLLKSEISALKKGETEKFRFILDRG